MMPITPSVSSSGAKYDRRLGEQVEAEAQEAVGAELQHDAGQDHRAGRGRLGVRVGQPRVQREQRHLDRERDGEGEEQPARGGAGDDRLAVGERDEVEGERAARCRAGAGTPRRSMPTSMNAEPNIVYRKNLSAA